MKTTSRLPKLLLLSLALTLVLSTGSASAGISETLDQEFVGTLSGTSLFIDVNNAGNFQEFSPSLGLLTSVEVYLGKDGTPDGNIWAEIRTWGGALLASSPAVASDSIPGGDWFKFTLAVPLELDPNNKYRLNITSSATQDISNKITWPATTTEYSCGVLTCLNSAGPGKGFRFRTYGIQTPKLDQEQHNNGAGYSYVIRINSVTALWQQFKPRYNNISAIGVHLHKLGSPVGAITYSIKSNDGVITYGEKIVNEADQESGWNMVYLDSPLALTPGEIYRVEAQSTSNDASNRLAWSANDFGTSTYSCSPVDCKTDQYGGGGNQDFDYQFRTYGYDAPIFSDGFESGNLSKWDKKVGKTSLSSADFFADALCKLCVVGPGSLVGSKSLKV
ncbi:MAG: hypothetical protein N2D54_08720, partial [Chloroflexota bacterium]